MDGREVLREIKADDQLQKIPVVVLTASDAHEDLVRSEQLQVESYMTKPVDLDKFLDVVRELRQEGLAAWATMDAGANVHVICEPDAEDDVAERLEELPVVGFVIRDGVGAGPEYDAQNLF